jgi:hypothetical protein
VLTACVTINVYFPAAQAQEAAKEFVNQVIGPAGQAEPAPPASNKDDPPGSGKSFGMRVLSLVVADAQAQAAPNFNIRTPAIEAIKARMAQRFSTALQPGFDSGALGFTKDGMVSLRDATKIALKDRVPVNQAVADDNRDRTAIRNGSRRSVRSGRSSGSRARTRGGGTRMLPGRGGRNEICLLLLLLTQAGWVGLYFRSLVGRAWLKRALLAPSSGTLSRARIHAAPPCQHIHVLAFAGAKQCFARASRSPRRYNRAPSSTKRIRGPRQPFFP